MAGSPLRNPRCGRFPRPSSCDISTHVRQVQRGGPLGETVIRYHYDPARSREVAERLLEGYRGYVQTDGYSDYDQLGAQITQVGCWAHARRIFDEAVKAQPKG